MNKISELNSLKPPPVLKPFQKRCTMRGLKKCTECGQYNGTRILSCKNKFCKLHQIKRTKKPVRLDTVQLISNSDSKLFSVQVREKDPDQRDFVQITDKTISSDDSGCIINRNAICYVDTCKYDSHDVNISCKHVKNSLENQQIAEVMSININVWYSLEISQTTKSRLWNLYTDSEYRIPMIQRVNKTTFVVKCDVSSLFPAGLIHFQILSDEYSSLATDQQQLSSPRYLCACKKLSKSLPNNRIILENNQCDHFYLIIATILSNESLKNEFSYLLTLIPNLFESQSSTTESLDERLLVTEDFIKFSENILNDCVELCVRSDDEIILATSPEAPVDHTSFSLAATDILSYQQYPLSSSSPSTTSSSSSLSSGNIELIHIKNDNNTSGNDLQNLESIKIVDNNTMTEDLQSLELIDCQIELMDQFKLTDHIDLCNDEIHLNETDIFSDQIICGLNSTSNDANNFYINNDFPPTSNCSTDSLLTTNSNGSTDFYHLPPLTSNLPITTTTTTTTCSPEITTATSAHHHYTAPTMKVIDPVKYRITNNKRKSTLFNYIEPVKKFDNSSKNIINNTCIPIDRDDDDDNKIPSKTLDFNIWLGSIIERINLTLDFNDNGSPDKLIFNVYHDFFNNLLQRFSVGPKCRLPSSVKCIETGRFKGLILFTWTFYNLSLIKSIFSTDLIKLQPERTFKMLADGTYQPIIINGNSSSKSEDKYCGKFKKIKPTKYSVCLKLQNRNDLINVNKNSSNNSNSNNAKDVFVIEWIPNVLKQSKHGEMRISFKFVHMINNKII